MSGDRLVALGPAIVAARAMRARGPAVTSGHCDGGRNTGGQASAVRKQRFNASRER